MAAIVGCAREHMPHARVAAVGNPGRWNQGLRKSAHLFDAISWHAYEPDGASVNKGGHNNLTDLHQRVSFVAGYGRAVARQAVAQVGVDLGVAKPILHTEFGYGLDRPGDCVLDDFLNGALHGAFHVSRIIEAINSPGTFAAITLESFVGGTPAAGPSVPVDPQAGNRTDNWCGLAVSTVSRAEANRPDLARVAGTGQLFAHFAATAFRGDTHTRRMRPVAVDDGPELPFSILGQPSQPCLQAVAFSEPSTPFNSHSGAGAAVLSISVLNICQGSVMAELQAAGAKAADATMYDLLDGGPVDPGPLHQRGWAPLPAEPDVFPWPSGPLTPTTNKIHIDATGQLSMVIPGLTFAIFEVTA